MCFEVLATLKYPVGWILPVIKATHAKILQMDLQDYLLYEN